jgi:hypothetical protein
MRFILTFWIVSLLCTSAHAAQPKQLQDPAVFSEEIMRDFASRADEVAQRLAEAVGHPENVDGLRKALSPFEGKKADLSDKVIDKQYGTSLRQIVYYQYIPDIGFLYVRFNYKRTNTGWVLANFLYKTENMEIFPPGFGP